MPYTKTYKSYENYKTNEKFTGNTNVNFVKNIPSPSINPIDNTKLCQAYINEDSSVKLGRRSGEGNDSKCEIVSWDNERQGTIVDTLTVPEPDDDPNFADFVTYRSQPTPISKFYEFTDEINGNTLTDSRILTPPPRAIVAGEDKFGNSSHICYATVENIPSAFAPNNNPSMATPQPTLLNSIVPGYKLSTSNRCRAILKDNSPTPIARVYDFPKFRYLLARQTKIAKKVRIPDIAFFSAAYQWIEDKDELVKKLFDMNRDEYIPFWHLSSNAIDNSFNTNYPNPTAVGGGRNGSFYMIDIIAAGTPLVAQDEARIIPPTNMIGEFPTDRMDCEYKIKLNNVTYNSDTDTYNMEIYLYFVYNSLFYCGFFVPTRESDNVLALKFRKYDTIEQFISDPAINSGNKLIRLDYDLKRKAPTETLTNVCRSLSTPLSGTNERRTPTITNPDNRNSLRYNDSFTITSVDAATAPTSPATERIMATIFRYTDGTNIFQLILTRGVLSGTTFTVNLIYRRTGSTDITLATLTGQSTGTGATQWGTTAASNTITVAINSNGNFVISRTNTGATPTPVTSQIIYDLQSATQTTLTPIPDTYVPLGSPAPSPSPSGGNYIQLLADGSLIIFNSSGIPVYDVANRRSLIISSCNLAFSISTLGENIQYTYNAVLNSGSLVSYSAYVIAYNSTMSRPRDYLLDLYLYSNITDDLSSNGRVDDKYNLMNYLKSLSKYNDESYTTTLITPSYTIPSSVIPTITPINRYRVSSTVNPPTSQITLVSTDSTATNYNDILIVGTNTFSIETISTRTSGSYASIIINLVTTNTAITPRTVSTTKYNIYTKSSSHDTWVTFSQSPPVPAISQLTLRIDNNGDLLLTRPTASDNNKPITLFSLMNQTIPSLTSPSSENRYIPQPGAYAQLLTNGDFFIFNSAGTPIYDIMRKIAYNT